MGSTLNNRDERAAWAMVKMKKAAQDCLYGRMEIFFENGNVTHVEITRREKPPVDRDKTEG